MAVKLQKIERPNGTRVFSVNIPVGIIDELNLQKGTYLEVEIEYLGTQARIVITES